MNDPTINQFADAKHVPRRTMRRRLMCLHAADSAKTADNFVPWLYRCPNGPWQVNVSRLRRAHGELFAVATNEELDTRLKRVERQVETLDTSHRALVRHVRGTDSAKTVP